MPKTKIPITDQEKANSIIADFNNKTFESNSGIEYHAVYKGDFLLLNRREGNKDGPIARLQYTGDFIKWDFAIYKWSSSCYDPDECFFPGEHFVDGTIEGALKASQMAYPPKWEPSEDQLASLFKILLAKKKL